MPRNATVFQKDLMCSLYEDHGGDEERVCKAFAEAENKGRFFRKTGDLRLSPEEYARAMFADGIARGWLKPSSLTSQN